VSKRERKKVVSLVEIVGIGWIVGCVVAFLWLRGAFSKEEPKQSL